MAYTTSSHIPIDIEIIFDTFHFIGHTYDIRICHIHICAYESFLSLYLFLKHWIFRGSSRNRDTISDVDFLFTSRIAFIFLQASRWFDFSYYKVCNIFVFWVSISFLVTKVHNFLCKLGVHCSLPNFLFILFCNLLVSSLLFHYFSFLPLWIPIAIS